MTTFDVVAILSAFAGVLFLGGLWANRYDAQHRDARKRNR